MDLLLENNDIHVMTNKENYGTMRVWASMYMMLAYLVDMASVTQLTRVK